MNTTTKILETRMRHLARLLAAKARYFRCGNHGRFIPMVGPREWAILDAIDRTKLPPGSGMGTHAMALLTAARAADCLS